MKSIQLTVLIAGLFFSGFNLEAQSTPFLTNGLVSHYAFNGNADDTFGTNNGTPYDITYVADRFGNPNAAVSFAGNSSSHIQINTTNLNLSSNFTISVWINYAEGAGEGENPRVFSTAGYEVGTLGTGNPRNIYFNNTTASNGAFEAISSTAVPSGVWTHIVAVKAGTTLTLYLNGTFDSSFSTNLLSGPLAYSRNFIPAIGANSGALDQDEYGGLIDDLAIYNRALSAQEVSELYESFASGIITLPTITIIGTTNQTYSIQYVTNLSLTNWTTLVSNIDLQDSSPYYYPDTNSIGQPQRFYRVVAQ
jgi:hypothetical protein